MSDDEKTPILVVDDLPEKLMAYRAILDELGQHLVTVRSGEEALKAVLCHDFAVILLDVNMPGMNGLETAALIRRRKRSAHVPIIFLTAFADEVRVAEGYAQGAVDYITTPVVPNILRAKVRVFSDLYRMSQQVKRQAAERIALAEERTRREAAEEANRRLTFLAKVGAVLGQSLDQSVTARDVVRLALPSLADAVALVTRGAEGAESYLVGRAGDEVPFEEGAGRRPPDDELARAVAEGLAGAPAEPGPVAALPLLARGRVFGTLALSRTASGRSFTSADITVAETFASRAAIALENARLYEEVQHADRQKNEFLSMLAHELRNPLAPIRNATTLLGQRGEDPGRVRWAYEVIDRQLTHLIRLVDDLLDVSRITLGKIRLVVGPVDLEEVVRQAVETVRPLLTRSGHDLDVAWPSRRLRVSGDAARLTQVFSNLLNNAAKYTEPGGRITVAADVAGTTAVVRVRDTGIGISPELLPAVFELFTQASRSLDRSQGGLGVGLTLVRRLVEMHRGSVEAFSDGLGCGSEFVVRLPLQAEEAAAAESPTAPVPAPPPPGSAGLRVVVIDDHVDGADSVADLLGLLGHRVEVRYDGPSGIAAVEAFDPDVVLLDIGLPGMDGYEVARRVRAGGRCPVLVAVSGYSQEQHRRLADAAGFEHHFVKPVDFGTLRALLESIRPKSGL